MFSISRFLPFALPSLALPSIALPVNIQRRFLSFLLKKTLGHLVKPDQLNIDQIEAQIGSGWVEIKDVELNPEEINKLLADLPVQVQDGSIGKISTQVPWPNIFTAPFTLTLAGLHVSLVLRPPPATVPPTVNLAESVTFAAESFLHDELTTRENEELRNSLLVGHDDVDEDDFRLPPGSIDPFMHEDRGPSSNRENMEEFEGVSVVATLMERLLARFSFTGTDTQITIIHEGVAEYRLTIPEVSYSTELKDDSAEDVRTVRIHGVNVTFKDLQPSRGSVDAESPSRSFHGTVPLSDYDDDVTTMDMSQSLASLPDASMYHSFTSTVHQSRQESPISPRSPSSSVLHSPSNQPPVHETILSFPSDPIVVRITNSRPPSTPLQPIPHATSTGNPSRAGDHGVPLALEPPQISNLSISVDVGGLGLAFRSSHLKSFIAAATLLAPPPSSVSSGSGARVQEDPSSSPIGRIEARLQIRGIVLLLLQDSADDREQVSHFFSRPLSSPIEAPHLRLHLETLLVSLTNATFVPPSITAGSMSPPLRKPSTSTKQIFSLSIADISLFAIRRSNLTTRASPWFASPILIFDQHLTTQYDPLSTSFPAFEAPDWRRAEGRSVKTSLWRVRLPPSSKRKPSLSLASLPSAVQVRKEVGSLATPDILEIGTQPVHLMVDLEVVGEWMPFALAVAAPGEPTIPDEELDITPQDTPKAGNINLPPVNRGKRDEHVPSKSAASSVVLDIPMIRVQIRSPHFPPLSASQRGLSRSGVLVLDLHSMHVILGDSEVSWQDRPQQARFASTTAPSASAKHKKILAEVEWRRILLSFAAVDEPRASGCLSVGPLSLPAEEHGSFPAKEPEVPLLPRICVRKGSEGTGSTSLECRMPSVQIFMTKPMLDGLQFWADDLTQWAERTFGDPSSPIDSQDPSMIGSRFFAERARSLASFSTLSATQTIKRPPEPKKPSEIAISLSVLQAGVRLMVPRGPADGTLDAQPFEILASDIDALIEVKPEGKNETQITLALLDIQVTNTTSNGSLVPLLERTILPSLTTVVKPVIKLRLISSTDIHTGAKESSVRLNAANFTLSLSADVELVSDLARFAKAPEGAFESVIPSERTRISVKIHDGSIKVLAPSYPGVLVASIQELEFLTELVSDSSETELGLLVPSLRLLFIDDIQVARDLKASDKGPSPVSGYEKWRRRGYAMFVDIADLDCKIGISTVPRLTTVDVERLKLRIHACADTFAAIGEFGADLAAAFQDPNQPPPPPPGVKKLPSRDPEKLDILASLDENAFKQLRLQLGSAADMVDDDLPSNLDYLDYSFSATGGVRELSDDEFGEPSDDDAIIQEKVAKPASPKASRRSDARPGKVTSNKGGETIRMLDPVKGLRIIEDFYDTINPDLANSIPRFERSMINKIRVQDVDVRVYLYDGYDWASTRKTIEEEVREMRRKLQKIRQLLASGQVPDDSVEDTYALLFNSVHIGLPTNAEDMETGDLINAIDEELNDDLETASVTSWQSLNRPRMSGDGPRPSGLSASKPRASRVRGRRLTRSKNSRIEICLSGIKAEVDQYHPHEVDLVSRVLVMVRDAEILDHIKTSTWKKFLTELNRDSRGNVRETDSNMVRVELKTVRPAPDVDAPEARLKMKILPLRLHVDQDALDFLKAFFAFTAPRKGPPPAESPPSAEIFFQHVEVFPIGLKLDYKPKRVDYKALREGKTIELMNFFHFDGAEMTLRHITLNGLTGWARLGDTLNDLWTPDVKANQLADVISGISPIRSVVNVGSGVADLILLPIAQYKKDKRLVRGVQKGTTSFVKTTAMEAVKLGARLATGTQVILEQAEHVLGGGGEGTDLGRRRLVTEVGDEFGAGASGSSRPSDGVWVTESSEDDSGSDVEDGEGGAMGGHHVKSKYAHQPGDVTEGVSAAYKSLGKNLNSAAQMILAVPMEVYERSGNEGPVRKVIQAVPIAVLRPMIGASEAVSKTLLGLRNTLDPEVIKDLEGKYKR